MKSTTAGSISYMLLAFVAEQQLTVNAFTAPQMTSRSTTALTAKPQRLPENVDGVIYVNDRCINCAACSNFAPETFARAPSDAAHIVHQQPRTDEEIRNARAALQACPVAAIRLENLGERRHRAKTPEAKKQVELSWTDQDDQLVKKMAGKDEAKPFPRRFMDDESLGPVYWLGHHNEKSFGATPYLIQTSYKGQDNVWIMVDTPKYGPSALKAVESLTGSGGPDYLFLTHVDDTNSHDQWAEHYQRQSGKNGMKRIFHAGDLGRHNWLGDLTLEDVEILLKKEEANTSENLTAYNLAGEILPSDWEESCDDEVVILHTPGHSPGSITLYKRPRNEHAGILFTGDTYGWTTRNGGKMNGFPMYGNNLLVQAETLEKMLGYEWDVIAPGHGHPRNYLDVSQDKNQRQQARQADLQVALDDMTVSRRW